MEKSDAGKEEDAFSDNEEVPKTGFDDIVDDRFDVFLRQTSVDHQAVQLQYAARLLAEKRRKGEERRIRRKAASLAEESRNCRESQKGRMEQSSNFDLHRGRSTPRQQKRLLLDKLTIEN